MTTMKNPPYPGLIVEDCLDSLNISIAEGARELGVPAQILSDIIAGKSAITPEMAVRLEMVIGSTAEMWMRMQVSYDLSKVREEKQFNNLKRLKEPARNDAKA